MTEVVQPTSLLQGLKISGYEIKNIDDEIRVDQLCVNLIRHLFQSLTNEQDMPQEQAGELCHGADYFLREFIIGDRHENLFRIDPLRVRQFAGHWYIIRTMEPNLVELRNILAGTKVFYRFLADKEVIDQGIATSIAAGCDDLEFYQQRIESYWEINSDGYEAWRQGCPLEPATELP